MGNGEWLLPVCTALHWTEQTYWYAVLLMGIGFVITMALFIKCFAAHTPSR